MRADDRLALPAGRGQRVTVVGQDDDVKAAVQVDLLEAVHQLTHDPVHALQRHLHLRGSQTPQVNVSVAARQTEALADPQTLGLLTVPCFVVDCSFNRISM